MIFPLHSLVLAPIIIPMLSIKIGLPQYQLSPPKAQIPAYFQKGLDIKITGCNTYSATQPLSHSATQPLSHSATQGVKADYARINGRPFHSDNNIIIFSHLLQTASVLLGFSILNRKEYHVCGDR